MKIDELTKRSSCLLHHMTFMNIVNKNLKQYYTIRTNEFEIFKKPEFISAKCARLKQWLKNSHRPNQPRLTKHQQKWSIFCWADQNKSRVGLTFNCICTSKPLSPNSNIDSSSKESSKTSFSWLIIQSILY